MHLATIRLRKPRRVHSFLCEDPLLRRDEACIVHSDRGEEWGTCVLPPEPVPDEMARRYTMRVVRRVNEDDERTQAYLEDQERESHGIFLKKVKKHGLPMKLVDVEHPFDKKKVIFYFTAEDRVDFRELVRDLAHDLRTRIELRHIQVRDEAKLVGGIGGCGRELCCSTWLNDFMPISMRMAKRQNLSLNPSKISGQCGRLLCCLSYENDQYESFKRQARKARGGDDADRPKRDAPQQERSPGPAKEESQTGSHVEWDGAGDAPSVDVVKDVPKSEGPRPKRRRRRRRGGGSDRGNT